MSESYNIAEYREEIDAALKADSGRLGGVFREGDDSPGEIARALGVDTTGFVSNCRRHIAAIQEGKIPTTIRTALETARAVRGFLQRHEELPEKARIALERIAEECDRQAQNKALAYKEEIENKKQSEELLKQPGIYVYSYPHYLNYPHIPIKDGVTDERMMMKVGMSGVGAKERIFGQTAAMPEEPVILYLFTGVEKVEFADKDDVRLGEVETQIHNHLRAIGHKRRDDAGGGNEWFLTNMETIASTARLLHLDITYEYNPDDNT